MEEDRKDPLALPSPEVLRDIAVKQDAKARELAQKWKQQYPPDERKDAAQVIQRNYRGYKARRELQGYGLDPSLRWVDV